MRHDIMIIIIGLLGLGLTWGNGVAEVVAQSSPSNRQAPDRLSFAAVRAPRPNYRYDENGKTIRGNDFFCSACAKEGRIKQKSRRELAGKLEVTSSRHGSGRFGAFRLLEEKPSRVLRFFEKESGAKKPIFLEDTSFRIVVDLPPARFDLRHQPRWHEEEWPALRAVFRNLPEKPRRLGSHHRAHLYLHRAHRVAREVAAAVGYDPHRSPWTGRGPFFGQKQKHEIYVFGTKKPVEGILQYYIGWNPAPDGFVVRLKHDDAMATGLWAEGSRDLEVNNTFTHRLGYAMLLSFGGYSLDLPSWLTTGFSHFLERRESTEFNSFVASRGVIGKPWRSKDWKKSVKKLVRTKKLVDPKSYFDNTEIGGVPFSERGVVFSLVTFLLHRDVKAFAAFVQGLRAKPETRAMKDHQKDVLKRVYGWTVDDLLNHWREWVAKAW